MKTKFKMTNLSMANNYHKMKDKELWNKHKK